MLKDCHLCDKHFDGDSLEHFCSSECQQDYWNNPARLDITTECPQCHQDFTRAIYSVEAMALQALMMCPACSELPIMLTVKYAKE
jgi:hypothetical protein